MSVMLITNDNQGSLHLSAQHDLVMVVTITS